MRYKIGWLLLVVLLTSFASAAFADPLELGWDTEMPMRRSRLRARHFQVVESRESREVLLLFALAVRGWNSAAAVPALERFLGRTRAPFAFVAELAEQDLLLKRIRWARLSRNYGQLERAYLGLIHADVDLAKVTLESLLALHGVSYKTAEYFLMYSRQNYEGFAPDVHILNYLRTRYPRVPRSSPGKAQCDVFLRLRGYYAEEAARLGKSFRELDTLIWEASAVRNGNPIP